MTELSFLLNFFILPYIVGSLLKLGRRGVMYAAAFLIATTLIMTYIDIHSINQSIYSQLGVRVDASTSQIRYAFRQASKNLHPDRNQAVDASDNQSALNHWKELLENAETRDMYDRFGPDAAEFVFRQSVNQAIDKSHFPSFIQTSGGFYVMWFVLTFVLCLGKESASGRSLSWIMLATFALFEWMMLGTPFSQPINFLVDYFPYTPTYVKIRFLHTLYPIAMNAARLFSMSTFVDKEAINQALMVEILKSNAAMLNTVMQLQASFEARSGVGPAGEQVDDGTGLNAMPLAARMKNEQSKIKALQQQVEASGNRSGFPSWLVPVGLMIVANWLQSSPAPAAQK